MKKEVMYFVAYSGFLDNGNKISGNNVYKLIVEDEYGLDEFSSIRDKMEDGLKDNNKQIKDVTLTNISILNSKNIDNKIESNDDLIVNKYYWCIDKEFNSKSIERVVADGDLKYIANRIWAIDKNSQALEKYDIYGPIEEPRLC